MNTDPSDLPPPATRIRPGDIWREIRPRQWTKNLVVFAAYFFALGDRHQDIPLAAFWPALGAFALFCLVSSGVYVFNDLADLEQDRTHPVKSRRPVAAGRIGPGQARILGSVLLAAGLAGAWWLPWGFALTIAAYAALQAAYTRWLKRVVLLDVLIIAAGFVLRVVAGGAAVGAAISPWLLICTFCMALFLALCKRRHERRLMNDTRDTRFRPSLAGSSTGLLDLLIAASAVAAVAAYSAYTQWPDTVQKFQTRGLGWTIPFVVLGILRYLHLVYRRDQGDQPEFILLTDPPLLADIALFAATALWVLAG